MKIRSRAFGVFIDFRKEPEIHSFRKVIFFLFTVSYPYMNCLNLYCFLMYFSSAMFNSFNFCSYIFDGYFYYHVVLVALVRRHSAKVLFLIPVVLTISGCFQEPGVESAVYQGTDQNDTWTHLLCRAPDG